MGDLVEIGDFSLARKNRGGHVPFGTECQHKHLILDDNGGIVRCADCSAQVSPYWALTMLREEYKRQWERLQAGKRELEAARAKELHLLAAQRVEKAWRSRTKVPTCPHCRRGIFPQDGFGRAMIAVEMERRRRRVEAAALSSQGGAGTSETPSATKGI